jgi:ArsR family transcriptional regulator, virulence genes transcriptional regulator
LGNPVRFKIVAMLMDDDCDVGTLAEAVGLGQSATSQHLRILRDAQIVGTERDAQRVLNSLNDPAARRLVETVRQVLRNPVDRFLQPS